MGKRGPKPIPARCVKQAGRWTLVWRDATGKTRKQYCDRAGVTTAAARAEMVRAKLLELADAAGEARRRGGALAYDTPLLEALDRFAAEINDRAAAREANPAARREGLSASAARESRDVLKMFRAWLVARGGSITTGQLDAAVLDRYWRWLATTPTRRGHVEVLRAPATLDKHRVRLRGCFRWLASLRPPLFPDFAALMPAFRLRPGDAKPARAFAPATLQAFLAAAREYESPDRKVSIARRRSVRALPDGRRLEGGQLEEFEQLAVSTAATPVSRLFVLLTLTGMRLGEALGLRWSDVDLERGRLRVKAAKTGRLRIVPLIGAPEGEVAPGLLDLLRRWRLEAGDREYVLPHGGLPAPAFPKAPWQAVNRLAGVERIGPQMLRQSFVSYASSCGVPATVAALWTGHSAAVAERWYRAQVLDRAAGDSLEAAMGLGSEPAVSVALEA